MPWSLDNIIMNSTQHGSGKVELHAHALPSNPILSHKTELVA